MSPTSTRRSASRGAPPVRPQPPGRTLTGLRRGATEIGYRRGCATRAPGAFCQGTIHDRGGDVTTTELDPTRIEEFAGRTVQILNDSMLALLLSVGHQTRLVDTLAVLAPST